MPAAAGQPKIEWNKYPIFRVFLLFVYGLWPHITRKHSWKLFNTIFANGSALNECGFEEEGVPIKRYEAIAGQYGDRQKEKNEHLWEEAEKWPKDETSERGQQYHELKKRVMEGMAALDYDEPLPLAATAVAGRGVRVPVKTQRHMEEEELEEI